MKIYLESNFMLLGSETIESIDFDRPAVTLKELLESLSRRSADSLEFLRSDGKDLTLDWDIAVNGRSFGLCAGGLEALLKDGDTVTIKLALLGGG
jgi:molybdopterin converting factor small subunit